MRDCLCMARETSFFYFNHFIIVRHIHCVIDLVKFQLALLVL